MDWLINPEVVVEFLSPIFQAQVTQFGVAFGLAAWIHSGRVRKEIAAQLNGIREAVNDLAAALRQDLASQSDRIGKLETRMNKIEKHKTGETNA